MGNRFENREFDNAAKAAGVRGRDWQSESALDSEAFHNTFERYERSAMSFQSMKEWAEGWWQQNRHKYS